MFPRQWRPAKSRLAAVMKLTVVPLDHVAPYPRTCRRNKEPVSECPASPRTELSMREAQ